MEALRSQFPKAVSWLEQMKDGQDAQRVLVELGKGKTKEALTLLTSACRGIYVVDGVGAVAGDLERKDDPDVAAKELRTIGTKLSEYLLIVEELTQHLQ